MLKHNSVDEFNRQNPLVSVVVVTYNSSDFLIETLDSIYGQTYPNIELVITDDSSKDSTVEIACKWIDEHKNRFVNCIINNSDENHGVTHNLNQGILRSNGVYIKDIAGDDILLPNCIEDSVNECKNKKSRYIFTWVSRFTATETGNVFWHEIPNLNFLDADINTQFRILLRGNRIYAPGFFAEKAFLEKMGLYDEKYDMMEDYPMWIKMLTSGHRIIFSNIETASYRQSQQSISNSTGQRICNVRYFNCCKKFWNDQILPLLRKQKDFIGFYMQKREIVFQELIINAGNDRSKRIVRILYALYKRKYIPDKLRAKIKLAKCKKRD